jgi:hypothetical protein
VLHAARLRNGLTVQSQARPVGRDSSLIALGCAVTWVPAFAGTMDWARRFVEASCVAHIGCG